MIGFGTLFLLGFAAFFYRAAQLDRAPPLLWAGLSILTYVLTVRYLPWGFMGIIGGQVVLFVLIGVVRAAFGRRA